MNSSSTGQEQKTAAPSGIEPFAEALGRHRLELTRGRTHTLQINVGLRCDLACRHCHLEAGPARPEVMDRQTMDEVIALARRCTFQVADVTGGAPELVPELPRLIGGLAPLTPRLMLRSNLTALGGANQEDLLEICRRHRVVLVASFPSTSASQTEAQRGGGVFDRSVAMLQRLNLLGYGREGSGLELHLVANPAGAFLPPAQGALEAKIKRDAERRWGITFNHLYTFANVPLGRFRRWLEETGNLQGYLLQLAGRFNPCTVEGLMCRSLVSVAWDGTLYDCDFNIAAGLPLGGAPLQVSELKTLPEEGSPIATGDHCYACTAGSGFT